MTCAEGRNYRRYKVAWLRMEARLRLVLTMTESADVRLRRIDSILAAYTGRGNSMMRGGPGLDSIEDEEWTLFEAGAP